MGAGMLAMPYAIKANGITCGLFLLVLSACTSFFGLALQGWCTQYAPSGQASFFVLAQASYPAIAVVFDVAIAVKCVGVGVSYLVIVGDLMPQIVSYLGLSHEIFMERNLWITLFMFLIAAPISYLRKMDSLKYTSFIALTSVGYLVIIVIYHFISGDTHELKGPVSLKPLSIGEMLSAFPIFVFAYTCHQNMFTFANELNNPTQQRILRFLITSLSIACSLYIVVGLSGYLSFGSNITGNIISLYRSNAWTTMGRLAMVVLVTLSFPLQCHPARASINNIIHWYKLRKEQQEEPESRETDPLTAYSNIATDSESESLFPAMTHRYQNISNEDHGSPIIPLPTSHLVVITTSIVIVSYLIAISVSSLEKVLGVVGSTGSTSISFILPGIFGYTLIGSELQDGEKMSWKMKCMKYGALGLIVWGVLVMTVCLSITLFLHVTH